jgi:hypothetical protein
MKCSRKNLNYRENNRNKSKDRIAGFHNNGTHLVGKPLNVQIENYSFVFDKNCPVDCASWAHLTVAMKVTFEVVRDILNFPPVRALAWLFQYTFTFEI